MQHINHNPVALAFAALFGACLLGFAQDHHESGSHEMAMASEDHGGHGGHDEHVAAVLALTPAHHANFVTAQSGAWSDVSTWANGEVPSENAQVMVAAGHTVVFDTVQTERMEWVRVDGTLQVDHAVDTRMYVETLVVGVHGALVIGTAENPIGAGVTARVTIADAGEDFDHSVDIEELGRGVISVGRIEMHGAAVTAYTGLAKQALAGDTEFVLDGQVENWNVGDKLVITGNEVVYITGISPNDAGQTVVAFDKDLDAEGVQGLARNHTPPEGYGLTHYLAKLDRNVVVESENPDILNRRGHVMFMHNQNVHISNVGFYWLGRTDKGRLINDVSTDQHGHKTPGANVRGRYSVHFHRAGVSTDATPGHVEGCVVMDNPGWGYVHHDSYANFINNVAYRVKGTAFAQEFGNERGTFTRNLAIATYGGTRNWRSPIPERQPLFDWGFAGHGFWLHSASISVIDNIAAGSGESGFAYFGKGKGAGRASVTNFFGNTSFGSKMAMLAWKFQRPKVAFEDFTVWNTGGVLWTDSIKNLEFKDSLFIGNMNRPRGMIVGDAYGGGITIGHYTFDNTTIVGWKGIKPLYSIRTFVVNGGYYNNVTSFLFSGIRNSTRPRFNNVQFGELSEEQLNGQTQHHIDFLPGLGRQTPDFRKEFVSAGVGAMIDGQQLYRHEQAADYINYKYGGGAIPQEFVGKTNQQLLDEYGVAPGGAVAPADAVQLPGFDGLFGEPSSHEQVLATLLSPEFTNNLDGYLLKFRTADGQVITETEPTAPLKEDWNAITREIDGAKQTVFVFGDITAPVFQESERFGGIQRTVQYSQLNKALRIGTRVYDKPMSSQKIGFTLRGLGRLPIQMDYSGRPYVVKGISYRDKAGNVGRADVKVRITGAPSQLPPHAANDSVTVIEDTPTIVDVLANDSDPNRRDTLTIVSVSQPRRGTATVNDGRATYTPNADYTGGDQFTYTISDGNGGTDTATVKIQVDPSSPSNNAPVAINDSASTVGQTQVAIDVLANDSDSDGDQLVVASSSQGGNGEVSQVGNKLVYSAANGFAGADTFSYQISDGNGGVSSALVTVQVGPNNAPVAVNDSASIDTGSTVSGNLLIIRLASIDVLANDSDPDGDPITIAGFSQGGHGTVSRVGNMLVYAATSGFAGADSFTYQISDGNGGVSSAVVTVQVGSPANNAPQAIDDVYTSAFGEVLDIPAPGVLANDTDSDGDALTASLTSAPANGSVTVNADGSFHYTPNDEFSGVDSFTYTVEDSNGGSAIATVSITVEEETKVGVFTDVASASSTRFGTGSGSHLDTSELDGTSQALTENIYGKRRNRRSALDHTWTFDVTGGDVVTFHATAGHNSSVETFRFYYDAGSGWKPLFTLTSQEMTSYSATLPSSTRGAVTVRVTDTNRRRGELSRDTVTIDAMHVRSEVFSRSPAPPVAVDDMAYTVSRTPVTIDVLANDSDPEGDLLVITNISWAEHGEVLQEGDQLLYTPHDGFEGLETFSYEISDGNGGFSSALVMIQVDAPPVRAAGVFIDLATGGSTKSGTASGSHLDTHEVDATSQALTERVYGKRRNRRSALDHRWTFDVTGGDAVTFHATAAHNSSVETFRFYYDDGAGWTELFTLDSQEMSTYAATLPASLSGEVTVRVIDTNRSRREGSRDTVQIDALHFRSELSDSAGPERN